MLTAAVGLLLLLSASGCGFSFSPTDLYSLPQLPEEYTELNSSLNQLLESGAEDAAPPATPRHGETGKVELAWSPQYTTFSSLDYRHEED